MGQENRIERSPPPIGVGAEKRAADRATPPYLVAGNVLHFARRFNRSTRRKRALNRHQLRPRLELAANRDVVFVAVAVAVGPWEAATDGGVIRPVMDRAATVAEQRATLVLDARPPLSPSRFVDEAGTFLRFNGGGFLVRQ